MTDSRVVDGLGSDAADVLESVRTHVRNVLASTEGDEARRERQIQFQALIAELATSFIGLAGAELDEALGNGLARIAELAEAERAALVRMAPDGETVIVVSEWNAGSAPTGLLRSVDGRRVMSWSLTRLREGEILHYENADDIPPEAAGERKAWDLFGLRSILAVPVRSRDGALLGFAVFVTLTHKALWREDSRPLFDLAAEMLRSTFEQKRLRDELERSELRLRRLLESGSLGILSADEEGRIWEANEVALAFVGATPEDLAAGRLRWDQLTPAEYHPMTAAAREQLERAGHSEPWEQDIYRSDGSRMSILVCVARMLENPGHFLIYTVDITQDKRVQRELAMRNRLGRLVTLFSTRLIAVAPSRIGETIEEALRETGNVLRIDRCSVWTDDDDTGGMLRCSHAWDRTRRVLNLAIIPPLDRRSFSTWDEDFRERRPMVVRDVTVEFLPESLERRFLEGHRVRSGVAVPMIAGANPIGFVTFGGDTVLDWPEAIVSRLCVIGEIFAAAIVRARSEQRQRRVHDELENRVADRTTLLESANRELEAFSYAVSHDLRAPLRSVDGFSRILVEDHAEGLPDNARHVLDRVRATSQRMGELIDALLRLSRIARSEPRFERVDLSAIVRDIATSLTAGETDRAVDFRIEEGLVVDGEPRLLRALMDNLLRNAWKFTSPLDHAAIEFGSEKNSDMRVYYVRDNGVGFEPSQAERIFMPFQRLHDPREFEGHGVGLATVKRIVGVHGGRVWGEGKPGCGATIRFTLGRRA